MHSIQFTDVSFGYDDTRPILTDANLRLEPGVHGLVGANGAGKSTFLSLLMGTLAPTRGRIAHAPAAPRVAWVPGSSVQRTPRLVELAERDDRVAVRLRADLAIAPHDLDRWASLSPGERMRFHLCAALADTPDVLLLDEPTSHIDTHARTLVSRAIARYEGICVLVSHDRALLDTLAAETLWLEDGRIRAWRGGYSAASEGRALERQRALSERALARHEVERLDRVVEAKQRERASAERMRSAKRRMRSEKDNDARGILASTRVMWAEARLGRAASVHRAELERAQTRLAALAPVRDARGREFTFEPAGASAPIALSLDGTDVYAGDDVLLHDVHLTLRRGERVWLRGDNGAGKTSLLRALLAAGNGRRTLYVPQELDVASTRAAQRALQTLAPDERGRAYQRLAALGCDPSAVVTSASPSAGEARKLAIASGLARPVDLIVLDEPTNHLDLPSIERLERALATFPGALLVVSHDARFAEALCTKTWTVAGGSVR